MDTQKIICAVQALAKGASPKHDISELLYNHKCTYLLLQTTESSYKNEILLEQTLNKIAIKERFKACQQLFEQMNFPYAVIKGAVLSQSIYGSPFFRLSSDIDIIINRKNIDELKRLLISLGFVQGRVTSDGIAPFNRNELIFHATATHQAAPFVKKTNNPLCPFVNLDVNVDIMWGESSIRSDMDYVLSHTEQATILGVPFTKLSPEMEFVSLCLHHYKDMNSIYLLTRKGLRLELLCDIYFHLKNVRPDPQKIQEICKYLDVGKYIYVCLHYANQIFQDAVFSEYIEALSSQADHTLIDTFGLTEDERRKWEIPLPERLFDTNVSEYLNGVLSDEEKKKIRLNYKYM